MRSGSGIFFSFFSLTGVGVSSMFNSGGQFNVQFQLYSALTEFRVYSQIDLLVALSLIYPHSEDLDLPVVACFL